MIDKVFIQSRWSNSVKMSPKKEVTKIFTTHLFLLENMLKDDHTHSASTFSLESQPDFSTGVANISLLAKKKKSKI